MIERSLAKIEIFLQALILWCFSIYFFITVYTGTVYRYVHERHIPLMLISAALFLIMGFLTFKESLKRVRPIHLISLWYLVVFIVPFAGIGITIGKDSQLLSLAYTTSVADSSNTFSGIPPSKPQQLLVQDDTIVMDNQNFSSWLAELYTNLDKWLDHKIILSGSVWKDEELFEKNEFALTRMMMVCCAADMQPVGLLAKWENTEAVADGEWIEITGVLGKKLYSGSEEPFIMVKTLKKCDRPQQEYIYP